MCQIVAPSATIPESVTIIGGGLATRYASSWRNSDDKAEAHEGEASSDPGERDSFGSQWNSRIVERVPVHASRHGSRHLNVQHLIQERGMEYIADRREHVFQPEPPAARTQFLVKSHHMSEDGAREILNRAHVENNLLIRVSDCEFGH